MPVPDAVKNYHSNVRTKSKAKTKMGSERTNASQNVLDGQATDLSGHLSRGDVSVLAYQVSNEASNMGCSLNTKIKQKPDQS